MAQKDYRVTAIDRDGYEISCSIETTLKAAKARARYFTSNEYAWASGVTDVIKAEVREYGKPDCVFDAFRN